MVCSIGSGKMTALPRLLDTGTVSHSQSVMGKEEIGSKKLTATYIRREIQEADEANLLDEEDMHIFGLRPMTDFLDLVCCNLCKKPIRTSHYAAHAELCKYLSSIDVISPELNDPAVNKKPPRKERKKSAQTKKASSIRELRKFDGVVADNIAASESHVEGKVQMNMAAEVQLNMQLNSMPKMNGSSVNPSINCSEDATKGSSKPLKRMAAEDPSNLGTKNLCKTAAEVRPYVPAPLATKMYYSQRNHHLRRAISHMFFGEPSKEVSNVEVSQQANAGSTQTSAPSNFYHEQVTNEQAPRDDIYSHVAQKPDQILAAKSVSVSSMNTAYQLPMNNAMGSHYSSNSYSFAGKAGNSLGTLQQGKGSVPVL